ncbi:MAG: hypothetical protein SVW02_00255 [Candidatus Nanohaloarchaea archaeon]|nr:hypothetical protein [Candidatus Nanohaloarchaea archaeon]
MRRDGLLALQFHSAPVYRAVVGDGDYPLHPAGSLEQLFYTTYDSGRRIAEATGSTVPEDDTYFPDIEQAKDGWENGASYHSQNLPWLGFRNAWALALHGTVEGVEEFFPDHTEDAGSLLEPFRGAAVRGRERPKYRAREEVEDWTWDVVKPVGDLLRYGYRLDEQAVPQPETDEPLAEEPLTR